MTRIVWSPQSLRDIEAIRAYIAEDSPRYADLTVRRIVAAVERLADFPESGRIVPERNEHDIREAVVRRFRVVYRLGSETVEIATVFRGSQEFGSTTRSSARTCCERSPSASATQWRMFPS